MERSSNEVGVFCFVCFFCWVYLLDVFILFIQVCFHFGGRDKTHAYTQKQTNKQTNGIELFFVWLSHPVTYANTFVTVWPFFFSFLFFMFPVFFSLDTLAYIFSNYETNLTNKIKQMTKNRSHTAVRETTPGGGGPTTLPRRGEPLRKRRGGTFS